MNLFVFDKMCKNDARARKILRENDHCPPEHASLLNEDLY